jgi:hypothetical protein
VAIKILYIGYWGAHEGLTASTIIPHIKILCSFQSVDQVIFCSIERQPADSIVIHPKVLHVPLLSKNYNNVFLTKLSDFVQFSVALSRICEQQKIDLIIGRSSLAGIFGSKLNKKFKIPYIVESFEPHANYMIEAGVWRKFGLRSLIQQQAERTQKKTASFLLPVSRHYAQLLINEGVPESKTLVMPCCVSLNEFAFNGKAREMIRKELLIKDNEIVGIYVGKFGDIYHTKEAYDLYCHAFNFFKGRFRLIILTGDNRENLSRELRNRKIDMERVFINKVPHGQVPSFLSAADFAFSTIRPSPSRIYCSPIKNGEYWANGLPILMEAGIGEDSDILVNERGGVLIDMKHPEIGLNVLSEQFLMKGRALLVSKIKSIAEKHRNFERVRQVYSSIINHLGFS